MPQKDMDENINKYIGKRIREIRIENGLKQDYLAEKLHINRPNISKYENGETAIPLDILKKISKLLNTSTDYLLGITNCKIPKADYRALCDSTGIDDTSIEILEEINMIYQGEELIPTLNFLIHQERLSPNEEFFEEKYSQIENSKLTEKEKKKYLKKVQNIYDRMYKRWKSKSYQPLLSNIEDYFIAKVENKNVCLTLSGEIKDEEEITSDLYIRKKIPSQLIFNDVILKVINENLETLKEKYKKEIDEK